MAPGGGPDTVGPMRNRRPSPRDPFGLVAVIVVLALVGGGLWLRGRDSGVDPALFEDEKTTPTSRPHTTEVPKPDGNAIDGPTGAGSRRVTLLMDGWSVRTLEGTKATYQASADTYRSKVAQLPLSFTPVSEADLGELAATTPDLLTRVMARLVTVDADLSCSAAGCTSAAGPVPVTWLVDPSSIPGYGPSYTGFKLGAGLFQATMVVPEDTAVVTVQAPGWSPRALHLATKEAPTEGPEAAEVAPPGPDNGYGRDRYLLGAALGQFFPLEPSWLLASDAPAGTKATDSVHRGLANKVGKVELAEWQAAPPFIGGLSVPVPAAGGLNPSQLTWMSSPSTGCGPGVACVPEKSQSSVSDLKTSLVKACNAKGAQVAVVVLQDAKWILRLPVPVHQTGAWNGQQPTQFAGAGKGRGLWSGTPPLVGASQRLRVSSAFVLDGDPASLMAVSGRVAQYGFDSEESLNKDWDASAVARVLDGSLRAC